MPEVLRLLLRLPPPSIRVGLARNPEVAQLAGLLRGTVSNLWTVDFNEVSLALAKLSSGAGEATVRDFGTSNEHLTLTRRSGKLVLSNSGGKKSEAVMLFALLDTDVEARKFAFESLIREALPSFPHERRWRDTLNKRALSAQELAEFLDHSSESANRRLEVVVAATEKPRVGPEDLVPHSISYYESLIGPPSAVGGASEYLATVLLPHLKTILSRDLTWGWRLARFAYVGSSFNIVEALRDVSDDDLLSLMREPLLQASPYPVVAELALALERSERDIRFLDAVQVRLARFSEIDQWVDGDPPLVRAWSALFALTLRRISVHKSTWSCPVYWRRLAAFVHAHLLVDELHLATDSANDFADWCDSIADDRELAATLLDRQREPAHDPWDFRETVETLATGHALRLIASSSEHSFRTAEQEAECDAARRTSKAVLAQFMAAAPDLLAGGLDGLSSDRASLDSGTEAEILSCTPVDGPEGDRWRLLVLLSKGAMFGHNLRQAVRRWAGMQIEASLQTDAAIEVAGHAAVIASAQSDLELADEIVDRLLRLCARLELSRDARSAWSVVMLAAAAHRERAAWREWLSTRLVQLAYALPRGAPCAALPPLLRAMDAMLRFDEQIGSRAAAIAQAGAG